jgi:hypothetical protein
MTLLELQKAIPDLAGKSHNEKIKIFGWWLHVHKSQERFSGANISHCYEVLHFAAPSSFGGYLKNLAARKELLKAAGGYRLENKVREQLNAAYGRAELTVKINDLIADLVPKLPDMAERAYYKEALLCYNTGAFRAAVIMTWNIAYAHLCDHVLAKRLADFNSRWQKSFRGMHKNGAKTIIALDDFNDMLKESETLVICRDAGIISKNIYAIMHAALARRNTAAHPNNVVIDQLQTDAYIKDLIENAILQIR